MGNLFNISRRSLLSYAANLGLLAWSSRLKSESTCIAQDIKTYGEPVLLPEDQITYYAYSRTAPIGGVLAVLLKIHMSADRYVSRAVLTNQQQEVVEAFYFDESIKTKENFPPYLIFQNIELSAVYYLTIQIVEKIAEKEEIKIFRFVFDSEKLKANALFYDNRLPETVKNELRTSHKSGITTTYDMAPAYYLQAGCRDDLYAACLLDHFPKIKLTLKDDATDGEFVIKITYTHPEFSKKHYPRHFIVTDPVGRVLALMKRSFADQKTYPTFELKRLMLKERKDQWHFDLLEEPYIHDCPYLMIFMDDVAEAFSQSNFSLV